MVRADTSPTRAQGSDKAQWASLSWGKDRIREPDPHVVALVRWSVPCSQRRLLQAEERQGRCTCSSDTTLDVESPRCTDARPRHSGDAPPRPPGSRGAPAWRAAERPAWRRRGAGQSRRRAGQAADHRRRPSPLPGVADDTIKLDFSSDPTNCGVNVVNAVTAAGAERSPTRRASTGPRRRPDEGDRRDQRSHRHHGQVLERARLRAARRARDPQADGQRPEEPVLRSHLVHKSSTAARTSARRRPRPARRGSAGREGLRRLQQPRGRVARELQHGGVPQRRGRRQRRVQDGSAASGRCTSARCGCPTRSTRGFAPFSWTQFATGSTIARADASYVCSTSSSARRRHAARRRSVKDKKRLFGLVHTNVEQDVRLANEFKGYLKEYCGKDIIGKEIQLRGHRLRQGAAGQPERHRPDEARRRHQRVDADRADRPLFQLNAAKGQDWSPEWIWSSFGFADSSTVQRLYDETRCSGSFGTIEPRRTRRLRLRRRRPVPDVPRVPQGRARR